MVPNSYLRTRRGSEPESIQPFSFCSDTQFLGILGSFKPGIEREQSLRCIGLRSKVNKVISLQEMPSLIFWGVLIGLNGQERQL